MARPGLEYCEFSLDELQVRVDTVLASLQGHPVYTEQSSLGPIFSDLEQGPLSFV